MKKTLVGIVLAALVALTASPAMARTNVFVGINAGGGYYHGGGWYGGYHQPYYGYNRPNVVIVAPPPVYYQPEPVIVQPAPVYVAPAPAQNCTVAYAANTNQRMVVCY